MTQASDLYQEVILDHTKSPRNYGTLEPCEHTAHGDNPVCGDQLDVYVDLDDGTIKDIKFEGKGCAISQASASVMTQAVKGKSTDEAGKLTQVFMDLVRGESDPDLDELGELAVFSGVKRFPTRVKCATLAWHTFKAAIKEDKDVVTTE